MPGPHSSSQQDAPTADPAPAIPPRDPPAVTRRPDAPAIFHGTVMHQRFTPLRHRLRYRLSWLYLDIDWMPAGLRLFSHNRFNLAGFYESDHLDGGGPLRPRIEAAMTAAGLIPDGGPIHVLCMPRVLGHVFNPISVFFCHGQGGDLRALLYEVHNTFGQRHIYLGPVYDPNAPVIAHSCAKTFHVSPFMRMDMPYAFRVVRPRERVSVVVHGDSADGRVISASFSGRRTALTDRALAGLVLRHGALSLKVLGAIHWEALRLWLKGVRPQPAPAEPAAPVTVARLH